MGEIIIKVPGDIKEVIEVSDFSIVQQLLNLKATVTRKIGKKNLKGRKNC